MEAIGHEIVVLRYQRCAASHDADYAREEEHSD
jgi:hypothetical protein